METKLEQIAVKGVNQLPKSVVREIRTPRSVGAGGGRLPPATRWAASRDAPLSRFWAGPVIAGTHLPIARVTERSISRFS
jgi:hypothetical protein